MSEEHTTLVIIAPTIEEAIDKGLIDLQVPEEEVEIEVLDSGSRGIFGLGSRQARVRLTLKTKSQTHIKVTNVESASVSENFPDLEEEYTSEADSYPRTTEFVSPAAINQSRSRMPSEDEYTLRVARETVMSLLEKMKVHARVTTKFAEADGPDEERTILVEIHGNDLSILIGRRSETLNALQYISSLIVGKELERWVPLQVDIEGYRARRERMLKQLAHRMADQAISTGKRQVLEPMPANERRVIHMELHDHPDVATESIGDEPNRKVTIVLKNKS
jgi:spoIIIJ-associated protein